MASEDGDSESVVRRNRFSGDPAYGFMSSLVADERIFETDLAADRAHVVMLVSQDIIESEVVSETLAALDEAEVAGHGVLLGGENIHEAIEAAVIDIVGLDGGKMHTIRSHNDEVATRTRYRLREDVLSALDVAFALRESLLETAAAHTETVTPGYTHLRPTQPTTVAHFLLSYERVVAHDCARPMYTYGRTNQSPLGSAAFMGTPFDVNRRPVVDLFGFDRVMEDSVDAFAARDFLAETLSALTTHAVTLSGLAADLVIFSNKGLVELSDDYSSTPSIMPQKKNPDTMELARVVAGDVVGELTGLLTTLKGLPCAYNRNPQRVHKHAFRIVDNVGEAAAVVAGAVASATWSEDELATAVGDGSSTATSVANPLAMAGLPFRTVHEIVAGAAARFEGALDVATLDVVAADVLGESLSTYVTAGAVEVVLGPTENVANCNSVGGPALAAVEVMFSTARDELLDDAVAVADVRDSLTATAEGLGEEVSSYI